MPPWAARSHSPRADGAVSRKQDRAAVGLDMSTAFSMNRLPIYSVSNGYARGETNEFGAGIWLFGQFVDRYATDAYGPPVSTLEAIERAGAVGDLEVLDINHPFSDPDISVEEVRAALDAAGLKADTSPRTSTRASSSPGRSRTPTLPSADAPGALRGGHGRRPAAGRAEGQALAGPGRLRLPVPGRLPRALAAGARRVRAVAEMDADIRVAIEYKAKEPRTHLSWSTAARTSLGIEQIGRDDIGIVVDLGHSLFAKEAPADVLLARARARPAVHDRGQRQLARVGRRPDGRLDPPHRDARVLPRVRRSAGTSRSCSTSSRSARIRSRRRGRASDDARHRRGARPARPERARAAQARQDALAAQRVLTDLLLGDPALAAARAVMAATRTLRAPSRHRLLTPRTVGIAVTVLVIAAIALDTTYGRRPVATTASGRRRSTAKYGRENFPRIARADRAQAVPLPQLLATLRQDQEGASEQYGHREGNAPYTFPVTGEGVAGKAGRNVLPIPSRAFRRTPRVDPGRPGAATARRCATRPGDQLRPVRQPGRVRRRRDRAQQRGQGAGLWDVDPASLDGQDGSSSSARSPPHAVGRHDHARPLGGRRERPRRLP